MSRRSRDQRDRRGAIAWSARKPRGRLRSITSLVGGGRRRRLTDFHREIRNPEDGSVRDGLSGRRPTGAANGVLTLPADFSRDGAILSCCLIHGGRRPVSTRGSGLECSCSRDTGGWYSKPKLSRSDKPRNAFQRPIAASAAKNRAGHHDRRRRLWCAAASWIPRGSRYQAGPTAAISPRGGPLSGVPGAQAVAGAAPLRCSTCTICRTERDCAATIGVALGGRPDEAGWPSRPYVRVEDPRPTLIYRTQATRGLPSPGPTCVSCVARQTASQGVRGLPGSRPAPADPVRQRERQPSLGEWLERYCDRT